MAAHTGSLSGQGLASEDIIDIRKGNANDPKHAALINFTLKVIETNGFVSDSDIEGFKSAGYSDTQVAELPVIVAQKTISNLFNHINDTDLDLPPAPDI
jgi:alkylhydroperoxidase family enzyme